MIGPAHRKRNPLPPQSAHKSPQRFGRPKPSRTLPNDPPCFRNSAMPIVIVFTLLISLSSAAMASQADGGPDYFRQWAGLCQPDGYCLATTSVEGQTPDGTTTRYALLIGRPAQQTYWEVSVQLTGAKADSGRDFVARV